MASRVQSERPSLPRVAVLCDDPHARSILLVRHVAAGGTRDLFLGTSGTLLTWQLGATPYASDTGVLQAGHLPRQVALSGKRVSPLPEASTSGDRPRRYNGDTMAGTCQLRIRLHKLADELPQRHRRHDLRHRRQRRAQQKTRRGSPKRQHEQKSHQTRCACDVDWPTSGMPTLVGWMRRSHCGRPCSVGCLSRVASAPSR